MSATINAVSAAALSNYSASQSTAAVDVVGIFDANYNQLIPDVRSITAQIKESADFPKHPLENGASIQDHRIIQPIEIELTVVFDPSSYYDDYNTLKQMYTGTSSLIVQTRTGSYPNMFVKSLPHTEDAQVYDTIRMIITLTEVVTVQSQVENIPQNANDSATVSTGAQQGTTQTAPTGSGSTGSAAYQLQQYFFGGKT